MTRARWENPEYRAKQENPSAETRAKLVAAANLRWAKYRERKAA